MEGPPGPTTFGPLATQGPDVDMFVHGPVGVAHDATPMAYAAVRQSLPLKKSQYRPPADTIAGPSTPPPSHGWSGTISGVGDESSDAPSPLSRADQMTDGEPMAHAR